MNKDTKGKVPLNLLPPYAIESIARVREFGNSKYNSAWGWLETVTASELIEATKRHLLQLDKGVLRDDESGLLHLEHAACSLMMALELSKRATQNNPQSLENPAWTQDHVWRFNDLHEYTNQEEN